MSVRPKYPVIPLELLAHSDLSDMPDVGGTNSDHDARYYTETEVDSNFLKLDTTNDPLTGNLEISKADPEYRLTDTGDSEYARLTRSDTLGNFKLYNRTGIGSETPYQVQFVGGSSQYITCGSTNIDVTVSGQPRSVSMWVNWTNLTGTQYLCCLGTAAGFEFYIRSSTTNLQMGNNSGGTTTYSPLSAGVPYHIVGVFEADKSYAYVNGVKQTETARATVHAVNSPFFDIGRLTTNTSFFSGTIDEVLVFDRVLSQSEVDLLYNSGNGLYGDITQAPCNSGLVGGWHLNDGTGTSATDFSGSGNTGTLTNTPTWVSSSVCLKPATDTEVQIIDSQDGVLPNEEGIQTFGDGAGRTILDGSTLRFKIGGTEKWQMDSSGNIEAQADSLNLAFGAAQDATITFTGTSFDIQSDVVTATDELNLRGGTNGIDFLIGATEEASIISGALILKAGNDIRPSADSTTAINIANAAGTDFVTFDTTNKRVGIGTTAPSAPTHIRGATNGIYSGTLAIQDTTAQAAGVGGRIGFGGKYTDAGDYISAWATLAGLKESGTTGSFGGYLEFATRPNGGTMTERMRITPAGDIKIPADSKKLLFGAGDDASINYDGNNMRFNSREVGSGDYIFLGGDVMMGTDDGVARFTIQHTTDNSATTIRNDIKGIDLINGSGVANSYGLLRMGHNGSPITSSDGRYIQSIFIANNDIDMAFGRFDSTGAISEQLRIDNTGYITIYNALYFTQTDGAERIDSDADGDLDYYAGTSHDFIIGSTEQITLTDGVLAPTTDNDIDLGIGGSKEYKQVHAKEVHAKHYAADNTAPVADGTYTVGIGGTQNGTITIKDGIITAIQEAIA